MLLKSAVVPFWTLGWPAAKTWYTLPVGSATIGPAVLLNVASPVTLPWPGIGLATCVHVWPSSVERQTLIRLLFPESWYDTHAFVPAVVIHGRSAPAVSSTCDVQSDGPVAEAGQRVMETPRVTKKPGLLKMMSRSVSRIVPAEVTSTSASPSPRLIRPCPWIGSDVSIGPKYGGG